MISLFLILCSNKLIKKYTILSVLIPQFSYIVNTSTKYEIQDVLCIICEECILNRCYDCKEPQKLTFRNKWCDVCKNKYKKEIWIKKSIKDKLEEYSKKELINLSINKSVKTKSSMKKTELINLLEPFMIESDFSYDHIPVQKWPF